MIKIIKSVKIVTLLFNIINTDVVGDWYFYFNLHNIIKLINCKLDNNILKLKSSNYCKILKSKNTINNILYLT